MDTLSSLVDRSSDNISRSRALVAVSRGLVARTRRARWPRFSGGSDAVDPTTRADGTARAARTAEKLRLGGLPPAEGVLAWRWVGAGMGRACDGCADRIARTERELEAQLAGTLVFRFHVDCFAAWSNVEADGH
ncbi:MAG TPA: hypothetical protein VGT02_00715 [Methylomirabilota bacterium]|jgi:hypothetical protein|nr:hypothetical protein [Methylomirabilota bacterium]